MERAGRRWVRGGGRGAGESEVLWKGLWDPDKIPGLPCWFSCKSAVGLGLSSCRSLGIYCSTVAELWESPRVHGRLNG